MRVMKFGGAVLNDPSGFRLMHDIIRNRNGERLLVVVSAFADATRQLDRAAQHAEKGNEESALELGRAIMARQTELADKLLHNTVTREALEVLLQESGGRLAELLRGVAITGELTDRTRDVILSFGEFFALHIAKHYLQEQGIPIASANAIDLIVTDEQFGDANALRDKSAERVADRLLPLMEKFPVVITQGFVARSESGEVTTMGLESSNFSAALFAELLNAGDLTIWTDVQGIRSADPAIVEHTVSVPQLSYSQAFSAAANGVKLIHPNMIKPLQRGNISLIIRSAAQPEGEHTIVSAQAEDNETAIIAGLAPVSVIRHTHEKHDTPFPDSSMVRRLCRNTASIVSLKHDLDSVCIITSDKKKRLQSQLEKSALKAELISDCALVSVIGLPPDKAYRVLAEHRESTTGTETILLSFGFHESVAQIAVPLAQAEETMRRLHALLHR